MNEAFLRARITATETQIVELETAISDLTAGQMLQYTINTGQGSQTVMKQDVPRLQKLLDTLYNRLTALQYRLDGSNVSIMRPLN